MKVRIAVSPGGGRWTTDTYAAFVGGLERRGFDTMWLSDVPLAPTLDPLVGLAFAAARTTRLKLGANVVPFSRNPAVLAKELAQLDHLSGGRLLLTIVPGLGQAAEREVLGVAGADRGSLLDEILPLLRRFWAGETVEYRSDRYSFPGVVVLPRPVQDPLELWLGGMGPRAVERAGRLADGWLGAAVSPSEAGVLRLNIEKAAATAGRAVDPEHFGLSIPYVRSGPPPSEALAQLARRRPGVDVVPFLPIGRDALRSLLGALVAEGLSKFVLRPAGSVDSVGVLDEELDWLAEAVLDLQT